MVLISVDTLRADRLGCYDSASALTPEIDALARRGVTFEDAHTPIPITLPAHTSMLTGLLPYHHGVRDNGVYRLAEDVPTLPATLRQHGYATAAVVAAAVLDRQYGLSRGFQQYDDVQRRSGNDLAIAERPATDVTNLAIDIAGHLATPFFLFVHYYDPHAAYKPPEPFASRYASEPYDGEVAYVDSQIGRLLRALETQHALENTIVILTADHGESLGEHGEVTHGVFLYEATLHVPLLVAGSGWPQGSRVSGLTSIVDIAPTVLETAGIALPPGLDGRPLPRAKAAATTEAASRALPIESEMGYGSYGWAPLRGLLLDRLKWIKAPRPELYDLAKDPHETHNLLPQSAARASELSDKWGALVREDRRTEAGEDARSTEQVARLEALGYMTSSMPSAGIDTSHLPDPKDVIAHVADINRARQLIGDRRFSEAVRLLQGARRGAPRNLSALTLLGVAHIMAGQPRSAVEPLLAAAEIAPANADVQFNLGLAYAGQGQVKGAERAWKRTVQLAPRAHDAVVDLADLYLQTGRPGPAAEVLRNARAQGLASGLLDLVEGKLALTRGDKASARVSLERALSRGVPPVAAQQARTLLARLDAAP